MNNWQNLLVSENESIKNVMALFEKNGAQIAIVTDQNKKLLGTVTDGDIRRGILKDISINDSIKKIMHISPVFIKNTIPEKEVIKILNCFELKYLPIVNENNILCGVYSKSDFIGSPLKRNSVVIMAGGEGLRLRPVTNHLPKPLVDINGTPIIEKLIINLIDQGFQNFFISINYLGDMIKNYFGDGKKWGVNIQYLKENKKLGTAGSLTLLKKTKDDILIVNGDLVTNVNFSRILENHIRENAVVSIATQKVMFRVPYGVINYKNTIVSSLEEKPILSYSINCGIYTVSPKVINEIEKDESIDMTCLINRLLKKKNKVVLFPIFENWNDIGNISDLERIRGNYLNVE